MLGTSTSRVQTKISAVQALKGDLRHANSLSRERTSLEGKNLRLVSTLMQSLASC